MLKDVVVPKPSHTLTVLFSREATQPPQPREAAARPAAGVSASSLRVKEYAFKMYRVGGGLGLTLDPTNVVLHVDPTCDASDLIRCARVRTRAVPPCHARRSDPSLPRPPAPRAAGLATRW